MNIHTICIHNGARGHELLFVSQRLERCKHVTFITREKEKRTLEMLANEIKLEFEYLSVSLLSFH